MLTWMNGLNWELMSTLMISWLVLIGLIGSAAIMVTSRPERMR
jgi:hypothetical protein